ncbi:MAG: GAF domain-containing protein [Pseudomonadota bacterium]
MSLGPRFDVLAHVVEIANSTVDVGERLDSILGVINSHLGCRQSVLFLQEHARSLLVKSNAWPKEAAPAPALSVEFGQGRVGDTARRREPQLITVNLPTGDEALDQLGQEGELAALFPVMDDNRLYAVLLLFFGPGYQMEDADTRLLQMVAREMSGTIRNYRLYFESKKRIAELNVLSDLGRAAISTIEVDHLLDTVVGICAKLLGARGGLVTITQHNGEQHYLRAWHGKVPQRCLEIRDCLQGCGALREAEAGGGAAVCDTGHLDPEIENGLCATLSFKGRYQGHLCVFDKAVREEGAGPGFNPEDRNLLYTMASMVSPALENALTFQRVEDLAQRNEEMVGALATLFEISTVLMTTVDFNQTVLIILHAVIHPAGLDHDRVLLFLVQEGKMVLRALADMDKDSLGAQQQELTRSLNELRDRRQGPAVVTDERLARLAVPMDPPLDVLARTVAERRPILVENPQDDPQVLPELLSALGPHPFLTVPMFAKGKVVGVLVADNHRSQRPFGERDQKLLAMLANQGGLALEASRLYQNLESANRELAQMRNRLLEADKLAALGEVAAGVAHEIRNPLVSIGGFTRRIRKKVGDDSNITPYLDVIIEEVTRLERTLNEMLDFSTDARNHFEEHDLNTIMDEALELLRRDLQDGRVQVVREFNKELPPVFCDDRQIKHVFLNIFLNALQAMGIEGGRLTLRSFAVVREGKQFVAGEVSDTGGGIPMDVIHNIFNPFFTTKDSGSGLGLSIVHKIVTRHFGQVEVHNREGEGASFLVTLPAAEEGRAYLK